MSTKPSGWADETVEHTFAKSGRTAILRKTLSIAAIGYDAMDELINGTGVLDPEGDPQAFETAVGALTVRRSLEALFVRPRLVWNGPIPEELEGLDEDGQPKCITVHALGEDTDEALDIAQGGYADAAKFRDGSDGESDSGDGEDVGNDSEPPRRTAERKRARAAT